MGREEGMVIDDVSKQRYDEQRRMEVEYASQSAVPSSFPFTLLVEDVMFLQEMRISILDLGEESNARAEA